MITLKEFFEIFQICIILFVVSIFVAFCLSNIFIRLDEEIDKITDKSSRNAAIVFITFVQLFITAIAYCLADGLLHSIRPWEEIIKDVTARKIGITGSITGGYTSGYTDFSGITLGELNVANYGIHIVLILLLLEMNTSLKKNLDEMAQMIIIKPTSPTPA